MIQKGKRLRIPVALLGGVTVGILVTVVVAIVVATLVAAEKIGENSMTVGAAVAILLGAGAAAIITVGKVGNMRLFMCLSAGAVYIIALMCIAAICFDGVQTGLGATVLVTLGGVLAAYLLGCNRGKRAKYKAPKVRL